MPTYCDTCGNEITFRYINGRPTPIHFDGRCSGLAPYSAEALRSARPTTCQNCGGDCFWIQHNGGSVFVDELGPPWPRHPCSMEEIQIRETHTIVGKELSECVDLVTLLLPESLKKASPYSWYKTPAGTFMLRLPITDEHLEVFEDLTGNWTSKGRVNSNYFSRGGFKSLEEGIQCADGMLTMLGQGLLSNFERKARIDRGAATNFQWIHLRTLANTAQFKALPTKLTHGDATQLIRRLLHLRVENARRDANLTEKEAGVMDELETIEIRPHRRQARTNWSVQRVSDKHWLRLDSTLAPPTDEGFKSRRRFKYEALAFDAIFDYQMAQVSKVKLRQASLSIGSDKLCT